MWDLSLLLTHTWNLSDQMPLLFRWIVFLFLLLLFRLWQNGHRQLPVLLLLKRPPSISCCWHVHHLYNLFLKWVSLCSSPECGLCSILERDGAQGDAKVGSLPHGCVHCRETSVYPPAEAASLHHASERCCARLNVLPATHLQEQLFVSNLLEGEAESVDAI